MDPARLFAVLLPASAVFTLAACGDGTAPLRDPRGVLLVVRGAGKESEIYAMRPDGSESRQLTQNAVFDDDADWSPDGGRIAFVSAQDSTPDAPTRRPEIFVMNADGSGMRRLLETAGTARHPRWSPDGRRIAFVRFDADPGGFRPYLMDSDGSNVRLLTASPAENFSPEWSPDGTRLLFLSNRPPRFWWTMYVISVDGSGERQLASDAACTTNVSGARWSPDGSRIAYACDGQFAGIYTIRADGTEPTLVSTSSPGMAGTDIGPVWSPDGRRLAFTRLEAGSGPIGLPEPRRWRAYVVDLSTGAVTRVTTDDANDVVHAWGDAR